MHAGEIALDPCGVRNDMAQAVRRVVPRRERGGPLGIGPKARILDRLRQDFDGPPEYFPEPAPRATKQTRSISAAGSNSAARSISLSASTSAASNGAEERQAADSRPAQLRFLGAQVAITRSARLLAVVAVMAPSLSRRIARMRPHAFAPSALWRCIPQDRRNKPAQRGLDFSANAGDASDLRQPPV